MPIVYSRKRLRAQYALAAQSTQTARETEPVEVSASASFGAPDLVTKVAASDADASATSPLSCTTVTITTTTTSSPPSTKPHRRNSARLGSLSGKLPPPPAVRPRLDASARTSGVPCAPMPSNAQPRHHQRQTSENQQRRNQSGQRPRKRARTLVQTHLDLGQRLLKPIRCPDCNLLYNPGTDDDALHARLHDRPPQPLRASRWARAQLIANHFVAPKPHFPGEIRLISWRDPAFLRALARAAETEIASRLASGPQLTTAAAMMPSTGGTPLSTSLATEAARKNDSSSDTSSQRSSSGSVSSVMATQEAVIEEAVSGAEREKGVTATSPMTTNSARASVSIGCATTKKGTTKQKKRENEKKSVRGTGREKKEHMSSRRIVVALLVDGVVKGFVSAEPVTRARRAYVRSDGVAELLSVRTVVSTVSSAKRVVGGERLQRSSNDDEVEHRRYHSQGSQEMTAVAATEHNDTGPFCLVVRIWVAETLRRRGVAAALVDVARQHVLLAGSLPRSRVAFTPTTLDGAWFAAKFTGGDDSFLCVANVPSLGLRGP